MPAGALILPAYHRLLKLAVLAALAVWPAAARAQEPPDAAQVQRGQRVFMYCSACHSLQPGQGDKIGPVLAGVVGAHAASRGDYDYSQALRQSGVVWTEENLEPGTKMAFIGLPKPEDRAAVIAYLQAAGH